MSEVIKSRENKEETKTTKVIIECRHHGQKGSGINEDGSKQNNRDILLSPDGRRESVETGKPLKPQPRVAVAEGSPQPRTRETAAHIMLANENKIGVDDTLKQMEEKIGLKVGTKIHSDKRLDFHSNAESFEAYKKGRLLEFLIKESDNLMIKKKDTKASSYLRHAGNLAEIYYKYSLIGDNFNKLANQNDKYEKFGNQMERYLGFHNGGGESFIAKLLEKTQGAEARDEYIEEVGGNGYKGTQGFRTEITNTGKEQSIKIIYDVGDKTETINIDRQLLEEIIKERNEFEEKIRQAAEEKKINS